jgi:hypothetical protein
MENNGNPNPKPRRGIDLEMIATGVLVIIFWALTFYKVKTDPNSTMSSIGILLAIIINGIGIVLSILKGRRGALIFLFVMFAVGLVLAGVLSTP